MRELRVQSRDLATYRHRVGWGLVAVVLLAFFVWSFPNQSANGKYVLSAIHLCLALMFFFLAPVGAADAISREKREGTLGLLLLTKLTSTQVVLGKLASHFIRLFYFGFMMLPFLMLPVLLGGVGFRDFLLSAVILLSIIGIGVSAGLIASALLVKFGASLSWAMLIAVVLTLALGSAILSGLFLTFPHRFPNGIPAIIRVFAIAPLMMFPLQARDLAGMYVGSPWAFTFIQVGLLLFSTLVLIYSIRFCARKVAQHTEVAGETKRAAAFRRTFLTPVLWRDAYRRSMSRKLDRNPLTWLEYRTAWARAARWAMLLLLVAVETMILISLPNRYEFMAMHFVLVLILVIFLTFKCSSSFQQEKESGAFELLLVTPLTESKLISARLYAVVNYYALTVLMLAVCALLGVYWLLPSNYENAQLSFAVNLTSICASLISVPVCGLFFALRSKTFLFALSWTAGVAIFAPICLWSAFRGLLWMYTRNGQSSVALILESALRIFWWPVLLGIVTYHLLVAFLSHRAAIDLLRTREFRSHRS